MNWFDPTPDIIIYPCIFILDILNTIITINNFRFIVGIEERNLIDKFFAMFDFTEIIISIPFPFLILALILILLCSHKFDLTFYFCKCLNQFMKNPLFSIF